MQTQITKRMILALGSLTACAWSLEADAQEVFNRYLSEPIYYSAPTGYFVPATPSVPYTLPTYQYSYQSIPAASAQVYYPQNSAPQVYSPQYRVDLSLPSFQPQKYSSNQVAQSGYYYPAPNHPAPNPSTGLQPSGVFHHSPFSPQVSLELQPPAVRQSTVSVPPAHATTTGPVAQQPTNSQTEPNSGLMTLGTPGLITAGVAEQMAKSGIIVEEFVPPIPRPEDLSLDGIPYEARQEFYRSLNLPAGSRVMSAQVVAANGQPSQSTTSRNSVANSRSTVSIPQATNPLQQSKQLTNPVGSGQPTLGPVPSHLPRTGTLGDPGILASAPQPSLGTSQQPAQNNPGNSRKIEEINKPQSLNESPTLPQPQSQNVPVTPQVKQLEVSQPRALPSPAQPKEAIVEPKQNAQVDPAVEVIKEEKEMLSRELKVAQERLRERNTLVQQLETKTLEMEQRLKLADQMQSDYQTALQKQAVQFEERIKQLEMTQVETVKMLEARTVEVTELQKKLEAEQKLAKERSKESPKEPPKKKKKKSHDDE